MVGIALVVFVFAAVLMMAHGLQHTLVATGSDDNVLVLRKSANAEITSIISHDRQTLSPPFPGRPHCPTAKRWLRAKSS